jgi:uridine kinase
MRVGISGTHGAGKTTLAQALCARLPGHVMADEPYYLLGISSGSRPRWRTTGRCRHARCGAERPA